MASSGLSIVAHFLRLAHFLKTTYGSWELRLISLILHGISMGLLSCTLSIYSAEITTAQNRGREGGRWQW